MTPARPSRSLSSASLTSTTSATSASSASSTSSTYSRAAPDLLDRLAAEGAQSTVHLWSAGNVRLGSGRDLTLHPREAGELIRAMQLDERFQLIERVDFGHDSDDWKISFRRTTLDSAPSTPTTE